MFQNSLTIDVLVYALLPALFIIAIILPYPKFTGKSRKTEKNESDKRA